MKHSAWMRRLGVVAALAMVLALAAGAPALQAQPEAGTIELESGVEVWNGHGCPAVIPVTISGLGTGLGGYETKIAWPAGRFNNTPANVGVNLTTYLAANGRSTSGSDGTPLLKAVSGDAVKFGDYSWGAGAGNSADGQLATVSLLPTATCGSAQLTLSETQLVDIGGNLITLTNPDPSQVSVNVHPRFDVFPGGFFIDTQDVAAVVGKLNQQAGVTCGPNYRYDVFPGGFFIDSQDVAAVVAKLNQQASLVCVD